MSKAHALHNLRACEHMAKNGQFNDWVVTTAFYSALHFVTHELFPLTAADGKIFIDLNHYYRLQKGKHPNKSKHAITLQLVSAELKDAYPFYKWLFDTCMNARYMSYKVSASKAVTARSYLDEIRTRMKK